MSWVYSLSGLHSTEKLISSSVLYPTAKPRSSSRWEILRQLLSFTARGRYVDHCIHSCFFLLSLFFSFCKACQFAWRSRQSSRQRCLHCGALQYRRSNISFQFLKMIFLFYFLSFFLLFLLFILFYFDDVIDVITFLLDNEFSVIMFFCFCFFTAKKVHKRPPSNRNFTDFAANVF